MVDGLIHPTEHMLWKTITDLIRGFPTTETGGMSNLGDSSTLSVSTGMVQATSQPATAVIREPSVVIGGLLDTWVSKFIHHGQLDRMVPVEVKHVPWPYGTGVLYDPMQVHRPSHLFPLHTHPL
jgi:hypothetical protein